MESGHKRANFMGINLQVSAVRDGTIKATVQYLSGERANGTLRLYFGRHSPQALIHFVDGDPAAASFGQLKGAPVFDLILCQELAITEIIFVPGFLSNWRENYDAAVVLDSANINSILTTTSKSVAGCGARPFFYGTLPVTLSHSRHQGSLLRVLYEFDKYQSALEAVPPDQPERAAPLPQCALIRRALDQRVMTYNIPLVAMKFLKSLLNFVQPLEDNEAENLRGYMRALLPHPRATHVPLERFYAFASAVEAIAYRRGEAAGDEAKKFIYKCIRDSADEVGVGAVPAAAADE